MNRGSDFDAAFDQHVRPKLVEIARVQGTLVACGLTPWSDAHRAMTGYAAQRGGALTDDAVDLCSTILLEHIDRTEQIRASIDAYAEAKPAKFWRRIWGPVLDFPLATRRELQLADSTVVAVLVAETEADPTDRTGEPRDADWARRAMIRATAAIMAAPAPERAAVLRRRSWLMARCVADGLISVRDAMQPLYNAATADDAVGDADAKDIIKAALRGR